MGKHPLIQIWIWTMTVCGVALILVLMWIFGQAFGELVTEAWGKE